MAHSGVDVAMARQGMCPAEVDSWDTQEVEQKDAFDYSCVLYSVQQGATEKMTDLFPQ